MIDRHRLSVVRRRLAEMTGDMPSTEPGGGKGGASDRTGSLAFRHQINPAHPDYGQLADIARRDSEELDRLERLAIHRGRLGLPTATTVTLIEIILTRWQPLTDAQAEGLRTKGDDTGAGWCQSHWRVGSHEPPRTPGSTLCRWCQDWVRALTDPAGDWRLELDMPPLNMVTLHAQGRRVDAAIPPRRRDAGHRTGRHVR